MTERCQHWWIVETPNGVTSRGVCKRCRAIKRFPNAGEDLPHRNRPSQTERKELEEVHG